MKPVTFFIHDLHGGGAEKITLELANAFARRGYEVDLVCQSLEGVYAGQIDPAVHAVDIRTYAPLRTIQFLRTYLKDRDPRVFFTILEKPSLLGIVAAALVGYRRVVPCVHTHLGSYVLFDHKVRRRLLRTLVAVFYRWAAKIVAVSEGSAEVVRKLIGHRTPVDVVYNGFDIDHMRKQAQERIDFPVPPDPGIPIIIAGGRMVPQKGFDVLLRAFAQLRKDMQARLVILGNGPLKMNLIDLVHQLDIAADVYFPGFVAKPLAWFAHADLFALSSRVEGFGNVLVEAIAAGLKVVSTDCPSGPREILKNGTYGILVPVDNIAALAAGMKAALLTPQDTGADAATQAYIEKNFSMEGMIDGYIEVMQSLA